MDGHDLLVADSLSIIVGEGGPGHKTVKAVVNAVGKILFFSEIHQELVKSSGPVLPFLFRYPFISGQMNDKGDHAGILQGFQSFPVQGIFNAADDHFFRGIDGLVGNAQFLPLLEIVDAPAENVINFSFLPQLAAPLSDVCVIIHLFFKEVGNLSFRKVILKVHIVVLGCQKVQIQPVEGDAGMTQMEM